MKTASAKELLEDIGALINANSFYKILEEMGLVEEAEYLSSTGSGEIKTYSRLTEAGIIYGGNKKNVFSAKTNLVFYKNAFPSLYAAACLAASVHADSLVAESCK